MIFKLVPMLSIAAVALTACGGIGDVSSGDKTADRGLFDRKSLSDLKAGIWIDPNGCDHWIIDDGAEGYLSARLSPDGKPVCTGHGAETTAYGPFMSGARTNAVTEANVRAGQTDQEFPAPR